MARRFFELKQQVFPAEIAERMTLRKCRKVRSAVEQTVRILMASTIFN